MFAQGSISQLTPVLGTQEVTVFQTILWVALPYISIALFFSGLVWRYRYDQFGWTARSSTWNESAILRWASPLFHVGIILVGFGHVLGLMVPKGFTEALGVSQHTYHLVATIGGTIAAAMTVVGLIGLIYRRVVNQSVRLATTRMDIVTYVMLSVPIALGTLATLMHQVFGGAHGYDYRETISIWFRSIPMLQPRPELMVDVPVAFQLHIVAGMLLFCIWPFTRLVHAVTPPVSYLTRPHIVYRSREETVSPVNPSQGW